MSDTKQAKVITDEAKYIEFCQQMLPFLKGMQKVLAAADTDATITCYIGQDGYLTMSECGGVFEMCRYNYDDKAEISIRKDFRVLDTVDPAVIPEACAMKKAEAEVTGS